MGFEFLTVFFSTASYRTCSSIKNIQDSQEKIIKTICAIDTAQNYDALKLNCESLNMKLAKSDSVDVENALIAYANFRYSWTLTGVLFIEDILGGGRCRSITNVFTRNAELYRNAFASCSEIQKGFCEFKLPRGKSNHIYFKTLSETLLCSTLDMQHKTRFEGF